MNGIDQGGGVVDTVTFVTDSKFYLNFVNTVVFLFGIIRASDIVGEQLVSFFNIGAVFAVLIGNVIGLMFINKDKGLIAKYPFSQEAVEKAKKEKEQPKDPSN